jgi:hypothetical protein
MIPNPSNSLLGNDGQPTLEQIQQRLAQQVQDNQNPNTAQQLIDLLQQSNAAMALKPGAGAEADQTLQQLNPTGPQSMQNLQNMRQEIEQERATDEYPFYDEKELQANFERQKRAEDKQWQTFISSYKQEMKDKINQEHKDHVTFMTATGGTPLNLGEFAQQTGYLGGNKLQEAWEAHKENAGNVPPLNLYDDYNQTLLDSMKHRDNFNMERYTDLHDNVRDIQKRISEHHAKGVDDLSQDDRYVVQNLMRSLNENARDIDNLSGESRNARNKEAEVHIRNIFPNGFNPSLFKDAILASDPDDYLKSNFKLNAHDVQNVTAEHHLEEVHPDTFNRIKESDLPLELKNSIINSNSLIPLYEQLADDIIEAHEAVDYTDGSKGIGNRIHEKLKDKYRSLTLKDEIRQPSISFEKLLYNKFSQSNHQDVNHLKDTMTAFNRHYDDDDDFTGSLFEYGLGNGFDYDIFRHLEKVNKERATMNKMFKSPLDYVMDNLIAKASIKKIFSGQGNLGFQNANQRKVYSKIPTLEDLGLNVSDLQGIRNIAVRRLENKGKPSFFQPTPLRGEKVGEPLRFERDVHREGGATIPGFTPDYKIPDDPKKEIQGTFVYAPDVAALAPAHRYLRRPDMSPNPGSPTALLGLLDKPEWRAGVLQGRSQTEGYQPHGFQQDSYVRLDGPFGYAPIGDRQSWHQGALDVLQDEEKATYSDNQPMYDVLSRLPATKLPYQEARHDEPLLDRWGGARLLVGEPMDIAMRLLKNDDGLDELSDDDFYLQYLFGNAPSEMNERQRMVADAALDLPESYLAEEGWDSNSMSDLFHPDPNVHESIPDHEYELAASKIKHFKDEINSFMSNSDLPKDDFMDDLEHPKHPWNLAQAKAEKEMSARNVVTTGEPMEIAMQLLKDRISPEAKQHKLEYDKKYESSPERVKYREELNRERRKRGIYGKHNHMDVSHTEGGKLTLESEHGNRARHFKEKGTLRHEE